MRLAGWGVLNMFYYHKCRKLYAKYRAEKWKTEIM